MLSRTRSKWSEVGYTASSCRSMPWWTFDSFQQQAICLACWEELSVKRSAICSHIQSTRHESGKKRLGKMQKTERDTAKAPQSNDQLVHPKGETLPQDQRIYSVKAVTTFLLSLVPLNKIPDFRELLEKHAFHLTDRHNMSNIVPFIFVPKPSTDQAWDQWKATVNSFWWDKQTWGGCGYYCLLHWS